MSEEREQRLDMWERVREARAATSDAVAEATRLRQLVADLTPLARIGLDVCDAVHSDSTAAGVLEVLTNTSIAAEHLAGHYGLFDTDATQRARAYLKEARDE